MSAMHELQLLLCTPVPVPLYAWVMVVWCATRALRWEMWT